MDRRLVATLKWNKTYVFPTSFDLSTGPHQGTIVIPYKYAYSTNEIGPIKHGGSALLLVHVRTEPSMFYDFQPSVRIIIILDC